MPLSKSQKQKIQELLSTKLDKKLKNYGRETTSMPFLTRLVQDNEKIAAYSFIHSLATTLGSSIYEEVSVILASESADETLIKYDVGGEISSNQKTVITDIISGLRNGTRCANIKEETKEILNASSENGKFQKSGRVADFYMKRNGEEYYFEIKTPKPNIDIFEKSKEKLLEWVARRRKPIKVYLAFPYNPYHPNPYQRFTQVGMMDAPNDFLVGDEYWDCIGGKDTFPELLRVFDEIGHDYKEQLNRKFKEIAKEKLDPR